jgi:glycosidase
VGLRRHLPALSGGTLQSFWTHNPAVLGFQRGEGSGAVLVLANFSEQVQAVNADVLLALPPHAVDGVSGCGFDLQQGLVLQPYQQLWLQLP